MTDNAPNNVELAYAQAKKYGEDVARLYAAEKVRRNELETITQKLQAIFDTAPNGLAVMDNALKIVEANPRFLALFQQTSDCIEQPLANLLPIEPVLAAMKSITADETDLSNIEVEIGEWSSQEYIRVVVDPYLGKVSRADIMDRITSL